MSDNSLFEDLFVLELANNHWGSVDRGLKIVRDFGAVVQKHGVKAAIKFQFRDVEQFIHPEYRGNKSIRYVSKTEATRLSEADFVRLIDEVRAVGCIPMATPFDERSVDLCVRFDMPVIKVASSDAKDWSLLEKVAATGRPTIVSSGGCSEADLDEVVRFFEARSVPLAINHCVSLYPSDDNQLEINQIDYLRNRYPGHVIGYSTHEYTSWDASMYISYAKGARTWERHIDIDWQGVPVSKYCSLPEQVDAWFTAFHKAREMCGGSSDARRSVPQQEVEYLDALVRGVYARRPLSAGYRISADHFERDFYLAVPLRKGQLSCREHLNGLNLASPLEPDAPLMLDRVDGPLRGDEAAVARIRNRGL